jgi:two-component system LytT family sensor kinase
LPSNVIFVHMKTEWRHIFFGRVARNIYFWFIYNLFQVVSLLTSENVTFDSILFTVEYNLLQTFWLGVVVYVNNLYLIPRFFEKRQYGKYFFLVTLWISITAQVTKIFFDYFIQNYPQHFSDTENFQDVPYVLALLLVSIFLFGFTLAKFANDYFLREDAVKMMEKKQVESELNFLKSQINPHFLFNTLNSIYSLALKKSDQTAEVVLKLSDLLRYILYECNAERILLSKEIETLNNYVELERIRTRSTDRIRFSVNGDPGNVMVAPLIWISFVENAFKHGMGSRAADGFVNIEMDIRPNAVVFKCMNNFGESKTAYTPNANNVGGIGMENLKKRLSLIYPDKHRLKIEKNEGIFFVELILKPDA